MVLKKGLGTFALIGAYPGAQVVRAHRPRSASVALSPYGVPTFTLCGQTFTLCVNLQKVKAQAGWVVAQFEFEEALYCSAIYSRQLTDLHFSQRNLIWGISATTLISCGYTGVMSPSHSGDVQCPKISLSSRTAL